STRRWEAAVAPTLAPPRRRLPGVHLRMQLVQCLVARNRAVPQQQAIDGIERLERGPEFRAEHRIGWRRAPVLGLGPYPVENLAQGTFAVDVLEHVLQVAPARE